MKAKVGLIIVSAGYGKRLGIDKTSFQLAGKPLFYRTYLAFCDIKEIQQIVIVLQKQHFELAQWLINDKRVSLIEGGQKRTDSVKNGLNALSKDIDYVLIHDGARPFVDNKIVVNIIEELKKHPAVICALKANDTVKSATNGFVNKTLNRDSIFLVQTPQGFRKDLLLEAYRKLGKKIVTDDAAVLEHYGEKVKIIEGSPYNIKITYPQDIAIAKAIIKNTKSGVIGDE